MSEALQKMLAAACLGKERPFDDDLGAFLAAHGVEPDDARALAEGPRRLGLYRRLVRHNVVNVASNMLERTKRRMEAIAPGVFDETIADFLAELGPRTPHLRDVPAELLAWAAPRWREDARLPRWLVDFAELELVDFLIGVAPRPAPPPPLAEVAADRPLVFAEPKTLLRLGWAVHDLADDAAPEERLVALLVYRDAAHRSRFLELTPLAAAILERLLAGRPLAAAVAEACAADGTPASGEVLGGAAQLLADLGERGVLLGALGESR